jgi:hypothetical protein
MVQVVKSDLLLFQNLEEVPEGRAGNAEILGKLLIGYVVIVSGKNIYVMAGNWVLDYRFRPRSLAGGSAFGSELSPGMLDEKLMSCLAITLSAVTPPPVRSSA